MKKGKGVAKEFLNQSNRLGIFFVIWFVICFAWFYMHPVEQFLHEQLMRLSFFYFFKMNFSSFVSGAVQSYLWGYIAVATWVLASKISDMFR